MFFEEGFERMHEEEKVLSVLKEADTYFVEGGIHPSEFWRFREEVRTKYGLPECSARWEDPYNYIKTMEDFAHRNNIEIRPKHEFAGFFEENPNAGAVALSSSVYRENTIVVQPETDAWFELRARANQIAHEIVHAMQYKLYPSMPENLAEWEDYAYQMFTPQDILQYAEEPENIVNILIDLIKNSVKSSVSINNSLLTNY